MLGDNGTDCVGCKHSALDIRAAAVHKEHWGLGFIFIAWISALFLVVTAELPRASYSNCSSTGVFLEKQYLVQF